jgi:hypothetical protein
VFQNPGLIDPLSISTFGVSSKEDKTTAIGFFGTGLKYAIAAVLRLGGSIVIHSGLCTYEFGTERTKIRNDEFSIVTMNGKPIGFTTELGKTWEPWQAFRELYCNMLDEKGSCWERGVNQPHFASASETTVVVTGDAFAKAWDERDSVILNRGTPLFTGERVQIFPGESKHLYLRGVRVYTAPKNFRYTYNLLSKVDLTEDRTIKYTWEAQNRLAGALRLEVTDAEVLDSVLTADPDLYEDAQFSYGGETSEAFVARVAHHAQNFTRHLSTSARETCRKSMLSVLVQTEPYTLDLTDQKRLQIAIAFCKRIGLDVTKYPIKVTEHLGQGVMGMASDGVIYISKRTFTMGTKQLAGTLIEEYLHLAEQTSDCTRDMQNLLIDTIVSLGERITKKPL